MGSIRLLLNFVGSQQNEGRGPNTGSPAILLVPILICAVFSACTEGERTITAVDSEPDIRSLVVGEASEHLDASGHFILPPPPAGLEPEIDQERAVVLAAAWAKQFAGFRLAYLESGHGGPIDLDHLVPCGSPLYAAASYEPLPREIPLPFRRPFGAFWMVALCGADKQVQVSLAVSARATDMEIVDGLLRFPRVAGSEFMSMGVPSTWKGPVPYTPEEAVIASAGRSGQQIAKVPRLQMPDLSTDFAQGASWHLILDNPVALRGKKRGLLPASKEIYVVANAQHSRGLHTHGDVSVEADSQPASSFFQYVVSPLDPKIQLRRGTAVRKSNVPLRFESTLP